MLIKELKDSLRKTANIFIVFLIVPVIYLIINLVPSLKFFSIGRSEFKDIIIFFLWLIILLCSILLGTSAFEKERKNGAFEYMLTFPYSRLKLLFVKFIPRLFILLMLLGIYEIILPFSLFFTKTSLFKPLYFPFLSLLLFILSFSFSLFEIRDIMALMVFLVYIGIFSFAFFFRKNISFVKHFKYVSPFFAGLILSLLIFDLFIFSGFIIVFNKFDLSPLKKQMIKFILYPAVPTVLAFLVISF